MQRKTLNGFDPLHAYRCNATGRMTQYVKENEQTRQLTCAYCGAPVRPIRGKVKP